MSSKAITTEQQPQPGLDASVPELAPSRLRDDDMSLPRTLGLAGAVLLIFGAMAFAFHVYGRAVRVNPGWALILMTLGICGLLYHAAFERDLLFRRVYLLASLILLAGGVVLCLIPHPAKMGDQIRFGVPCLFLAVLFFLSGLRNETDDGFRRLFELIFGAAGALLAVVGLLGGTIRSDFLIPVGLVFGVFGLVYLAAFVSSRGVSDDHAYYAALGMAALGVVLILIAIGRGLFANSGADYFTGYGTVLVLVGLCYTIAGGGLASDVPMLILLRRELGAFFYSPITYILLFAFSFVWGVNAYFFWMRLFPDDPGGSPLVEPIVAYYVLSIFPIITALFAAPVLTMGSFSEESKSGTMEVLLTAPVKDHDVLFSKFLAALFAYVLVWMPAGVYLLALLAAGANPFDYRPLLSFFIVLVCWGAAFVAMGLFFSSLTREMLIAAVLSFAGMLAWTFLYIIADNYKDRDWGQILAPMSYIHAWESGLEGKIVPRLLLFPLSVAAFYLFLTHKVLESRKWR